MHWSFSKLQHGLLLPIILGILWQCHAQSHAQDADTAIDLRPIYMAQWTRSSTLAWASLNPTGTLPTPVPQRFLHGNVPLGSLWKLFYWLYSTGNHLPDLPYRCQSPAIPTDVYCCDAGQSIQRNQALLRSCSTYFLLLRPHIDPQTWQHWWQQQAPHSPWLARLANLRPDYSLSVVQLLSALQEISLKDEARLALLPRFLQPAWQNFLAEAGSGYRFKTFTWDDPDHPGAVLGGSAGWLYDGTPFWIAGAGSSTQVMNRSAALLGQRLLRQAQADNNHLDSCVDVQFFSRYPLNTVSDSQGQPLHWSGSVPGTVYLRFVNGQRLRVESNDRLHVDLQQAHPVLSARLSLEDYIARVIDREAHPAATQAAYALAIAARTWLIQNAAFAHGCWQVEDDSRQQRVSPSPPSPLAWQDALFTEGLALEGQSVTYQQQGQLTDRLSWEQAVQEEQRGLNYLSILKTAFPASVLTTLSGESNCLRLYAVENWLQQRLPHVNPLLYQQPGYEPVAHLMICQLNYGTPYADQRQEILWIRRLWSHEDHISLWHEYLHLAFKNHPNGANERYIEQWATTLAQDN